MKSQGLRGAPWRPGLQLGAVREAGELRFTVNRLYSLTAADGTLRVPAGFELVRGVGVSAGRYLLRNLDGK